METTNDFLTRRLIEPATGSGRRRTAAALVLAAVTVYWMYWALRVLAGGNGVTPVSVYGASWGLIVANIVHLIGISHVGIAISATVRVLRLHRYRAIARIAELTTLIALVTAVVNIGLDVGRPDRFIVNTLVYGNWRAPMVWSMTVIVLYFSASTVYLFLSLRRDAWYMAQKGYTPRRLYAFLASRYGDSDAERDRQEQTLYWLAIVLVPVMVSVHSVYGLFFGLMSAKVGWYNPLQAPYFVLGAVVSGFSAIIVIGAVLRWALDWRDVLTGGMFRALGAFLAFVVFLYLYFLASEHLTAQYFPATAEKAVSDSILSGRYAPAFWITVFGGLVTPFIYLLIRSVRGGEKIVGIAAAALLVNVAMFYKRLLLVVPPQYFTQLPLPRDPVPFSPSHADIVLVAGSYTFAALLFMIVMRFLPAVELPAPLSTGTAKTRRHESALRKPVLLATLAAGVSMILWGIGTREADFAPLKWITGLMCLVMIPLENCLIMGKRQKDDATRFGDGDLS